MRGGLRKRKQASLAEPRPTPHRFKIQRRQLALEDQQRRHDLRQQHLMQLGQWQTTTDRLFRDAQAAAEAIIHAAFGVKWAELLKARGAPDFTARSEALKAEQHAALAAQRQRSQAIVRQERAAARALLLDAHRRERKQLARRRLLAMAAVSPQAVLAEFIDRRRRKILLQQLRFAFAAQMTTTRGLAGIGRIRPPKQPPSSRTPPPSGRRPT